MYLFHQQQQHHHTNTREPVRRYCYMNDSTNESKTPLCVLYAVEFPPLATWPRNNPDCPESLSMTYSRTRSPLPHLLVDATSKNQLSVEKEDRTTPQPLSPHMPKHQAQQAPLQQI